MTTPYTTKNGEITTKEALIKEIESILNLIPAKSQTTLSLDVMNSLECSDLESIRDSLLQKHNAIIAENKEWLLGLADG